MMSNLSNQETMDSIREALAEARANNGFNARQIAAISTLCDRLVLDDPSLTWFVEEIRQSAQEAVYEAAAKGQDDISRMSMVQIL